MIIFNSIFIVLSLILSFILIKKTNIYCSDFLILNYLIAVFLPKINLIMFLHYELSFSLLMISFIPMICLLLISSYSNKEDKKKLKQKAIRFF